MNLAYYFYSFGSTNIAEHIMNALENKDYETFMLYFTNSLNGILYLLPEEAYVDDEDGEEICLSVCSKEVFDKIKVFEFENG